MKLEQSFEVDAPVERVWQALIDVERVAPCLPGAGVTGRNEDGSYSGTFTVKIGPTTASYTGKLEMESVDEQTHSATMSAQGSDKRGQGGATAKILSRLEDLGDGRTRVDVDTDYHITGRLARFGRGGMIEDISERLLKEFASRLAQSLEGSEDQAGGEGVEERAVSEDVEEGDEAPTVEVPAVVLEEAGEAVDRPAPIEAAPPAPTEVAEELSAEVVEEPAPEVAGEPAPTEAAPPPPPPVTAAPPPASEPLDANSLVRSMVAERVRANPWPLVGGALLLLALRRRRRRR